MNAGDTVKLVQPVVRGLIVDTRYDKQSKSLEHLVEYKDANGDGHARWFLESQLERAK